MRRRYLSDEQCQSFTSPATCPSGCEWNVVDGGATSPVALALQDLTLLPLEGGREGGCSAVGLLSKAYARARRDLRGRARALKTPLPAGNFSQLQWRDWLPGPLDSSGTTHFSVVDAEGNMVAMTTTIEDNLGSGIVVPGRGFLLNNELTDFSYNPTTGSGKGYANRPEGGKRQRVGALGSDALTYGGKRPRSSMTPTIVLDSQRKPLLAIGSPGGGRIAFTVLGALIAVMDFKMGLREAIDAPRAIARNGPLELETRNKCKCSNPLSEDLYLLSVLRARGMLFSFALGSTTSDYLEAVMLLSNGTFDGYADTNRMPTALGYAKAV